MRALHVHATLLPRAAPSDLFIVDGRWTFHEPTDAETFVEGGYLVPGLVDAHAHLSLYSPAGDDAPAPERVRASAATQLAVGVLALREPGSPDRASLSVGPAMGLPRVQTAGALLCAPGRYIPGLAREVSADELPDAAAEEAAASRGWVKVIADFPGPDGRITPTYPAEALGEAARRAHAAGARIAGHVTCPEVIEAAIEAGFDSLEHATMLQPEHLPELARRGIAVVPTLVIGDAVLAAAVATGAGPDAVAHLRAVLAGLPEIVRQAAELGITVLAGTDAGMVPHGRVVDEVAILLAAGLPPEAAIGAASWTAREWLGLPGVEEGAPADAVIYPDDPRGDPDVLRHPRHILLDGRRVERTTAVGLP